MYAGAPRVSVSLAEVAGARRSAGLPLRDDGFFDASSLIPESQTGEHSPFPVYVSATHLAEVEVNPERGEVRVIRIVAAHDVGRAVFPQGLKGQIEGSVAMGVGYALTEEFLPGETTGMKQYRILTARDVPEVVILLVEDVDPRRASEPKEPRNAPWCPSPPPLPTPLPTPPAPASTVSRRRPRG